jgi:hypothetical protein
MYSENLLFAVFKIITLFCLAGLPFKILSEFLKELTKKYLFFFNTCQIVYNKKMLVYNLIFEIVADQFVIIALFEFISAGIIFIFFIKKIHA